MPHHVLPGDLFLDRSGSLVSRTICFLTRSWGESRSKVSHVGVVVGYGGQVVEAVAPTVRRSILPPRAAVFRARSIHGAAVASVAERYVGRRYGYGKLLAHLGDWLLGGAYVFRRIARMEQYPICSWVAAYSFEEVGLRFGAPPWAVDPDSIWDWVTTHPAEWACIRRFQ